MKRDVVITGIGVVLPKTRSLDDLWNYQGSSKSHIERLSPRIAGSRIESDLIAGMLPIRLSKKLDAFTKYALVATHSALEDAGLDVKAIDGERCGVFVGNCFGGWQFTETELRNLHRIGPRAVSPFQATSWFPAAPQGQISIMYGLKGFSKTYTVDRVSSLLSVASAANLIRQGRLDLAIAGGTESTNTDFVRSAIEMIPMANRESDPDRSGFELSEGSVFLVLEDAEHAAARGARVYARVGAFAMRNAPCAAEHYTTDAGVLQKTMRRVLGNTAPDIVVLDASGLRAVDECEKQAVESVCPDARLATPKRKYGHAFGAEGALDIAYASLMLQRQQELPTPPAASAPLSAAHTTVERLATIEQIMINACAMGGAVASLVLQHGDMK